MKWLTGAHTISGHKVTLICCLSSAAASSALSRSASQSVIVVQPPFENNGADLLSGVGVGGGIGWPTTNRHLAAASPAPTIAELKRAGSQSLTFISFSLGLANDFNEVATNQLSISFSLQTQRTDGRRRRGAAGRTHRLHRSERPAPICMPAADKIRRLSTAAGRGRLLPAAAR